MKLSYLITAVFLALTGIIQELPKVKMVTNLGEIVVELDTIHAPITARNFVNHVKNETFKTALFYRVVRMDNQPNNEIKIEVIQGGLYNNSQIEKIPPIAHETTKQTGLKHFDGTLSMARMEPGTASTEFFICVGNQPELDYGGKRNSDGQGFAAFGRVIKGMDIVRKIQQQKDNGQILEKPVRVNLIEIVP